MTETDRKIRELRESMEFASGPAEIAAIRMIIAELESQRFMK